MGRRGKLATHAQHHPVYTHMSTRIHCRPAGQQKGGGAHWPQPEAAYLDPLCPPSDTVLIKPYPYASIATCNTLLAAASRKRDAVGSTIQCYPTRPTSAFSLVLAHSPTPTQVAVRSTGHHATALVARQIHPRR
jgi:hypothetical protein